MRKHDEATIPPPPPVWLLIIVGLLVVAVVINKLNRPHPSPEIAIVSILNPVAMSQGTGVIIDSTGLILTAGHVLDGCDKPIIIFHDGRKAFDIKSVFVSPDVDVGLIQIKADTPLPFMRFGESANLRPGDN